MNRLDDAGTYPIREFARLTGVNPVTLRAWERRYGIIRPERTAKGHRFYTEDHILLVKNILYWLDQGYPIRQVKLLLQEGVQADSPAGDDWQEQQQQIIQAAYQLNSQRLDELWNIGFATYPLAVYYDHCLRPVIQTLRLDASPAIGKAVHYLLKRRLSSLMIQQQRHNPGPGILIACNERQIELDALACACALGAAEFHVEYFGCDLIPDELKALCQQLQAERVWLHLHPLATAQADGWQQLNECATPVCISGVIPQQSEEHETSQLTYMQGSLSQQVRQFITGNALTENNP
ncbi:MAG: hypothetical protein CMI03_11365 [Oceanospirillaceae bacterium]|uniref:MerR family transcriptional regulator n=1 Tax=unclassified Thalassolituus TaxID=2624967 RepID=UPI000C0AEF04|nr:MULTISPECIES: MerR family transcriptional regulator [unclassified Thalassolituus]MAK91549.1 hypothetical protein [Thalassolituus sp.]MAS25268.1 hypothetical protein [Oceanospirillaceae bacterium]MBL35388.1 hypothetical protein [Oceanospirillaceae bacterium]MBS53333.1 hypothetical protein [Oceanospirillaceae bacterium]|tara:strand:- start:471 stop:1349 length:879 start_codon:yes stop_codon:yes gene_type:complete